MKILFLLQEIPYPPSNGIRWKAYNLIKYLSNEHECHILCFGDPKDDRVKQFAEAVPRVQIIDVVAPPPVGPAAWLRKARCVAKNIPPSFANYESKRFAQVFKRVLCQHEFDVVHYDIINMAQYWPIGQLKPSVHSPNDATSLLYLRNAGEERNIFKKAKLRLASRFLRKFERTHYSKFSKVHVVSMVDLRYLEQLAPTADVEVVPIAVDDSFVSVPKCQRAEGEKAQSGGTIVFSGDLSVPGIKNGLREFIELGFPVVLDRYPHAQLVVIGRNASGWIRQYLKSKQNVQHCAWVEDYLRAISAGDVVIAPDKSGTGIKNRILQAMALRLPVVGTSIAFESIDVTDGIHGFVRSSPLDMASAVIALLDNGHLRDRVGRMASDLIRSTYSFHEIGKAYEMLYRRAVDRHYALDDREPTQRHAPCMSVPQNF